MTSKSPVRSCEDVDETALSYAEIKALCAGNPLIKEKMGLDTDVARLRLMKAAHQSQQYTMEDRLLKYFPEQVESTRHIIAGFQDDLATRDAHVPPHEGFIGMEVCGSKLSEKEDAGKAILEACKMVKDMQAVEIGNYRGFAMTLSVENFGREHVLSLKGKVSHAVTLGTDPRGNIQRIDNMLAAMEERLQYSEAQLSNLEQQREAAQQTVGKPFPQEDELREKSARLAELDAKLNLAGEQDAGQTKEQGQGCEVSDASDTRQQPKPSVLAGLRKSAAEMELARKPRQHQEKRRGEPEL